MIDYRDKLKIDKFALDSEIAMQSDRFARVARLYARAASVRDQAKDDLKAVTGRRSRELRRESTRRDGKPPSEAKLEALVMEDKERCEAATRLVNAEREAEDAKGLKEAWADRGWMLREMCSLFRDGYYSDISVKSREAREVADEEVARIKRRVAEKRNSRR